jgi:hypothetical protein
MRVGELDQFLGFCGADALVRSPAPWPGLKRDQGAARGSGDPPKKP